MTIELLKETINYVSGAPFFWGSMGFTAAVAMFAGVLLYDGYLNQVMKGVVSVLSYAAMLFWITISRVLEATRVSEFPHNVSHPEYAYAGIVALAFLTLSWLFGTVTGVSIFKFKYRGRHVD